MTRFHGLLLALFFVLVLPLACGTSNPTSSPPPGGSSCAAGQAVCGGSCVTLSNDSANCGACGKACAGGSTCVAGACACQSGSINCGGQCVTLSNNSANCGACGTACAVGSACVAGACACQSGSISCSGQCVNPALDANNCGSCGTKCQTGQICGQSNGVNSCQCATGLSNCAGSCVDVSSNPADCGACGTACSAGLVCSTSTCKAGCDAGLTQCGQSCVSTQTSLTNCGTCGTTCGAGQACNAGVCGCAAGQALCAGQCVDSANDAQNCGGCGIQCTGGRACTSGACGCPSGQTFCNGACVAGTSCGGGSGGAGGTGAGGGSTAGTGGSSAGSGGSGGSGPPLETPVDLSCSANGKTFTVPGADVISDFRGMPIMYAVGARGATGWYAYGAEDPAGASTGASTPGVGSNVFAIDTTTVGPCNSGGSLKVSSTGNDGSAGWGVGFGVNMMPTVTGQAGKATYDAKAAGYTGIGFFMKCQNETDFAYVKTVDAANDADAANPICSYASGSSVICNQYGQKNETIVKDWTYFKVHFGETLQDWDGNGTITSSGLNSSKLTAFQIQVNTQYTRDGSARVKNPFTCWIDDVHFVKDAPPAPSVTPKACTTNAANAAPGGYYVTGNQIMDCKTGTAHIFRGVARPSFEWDRAGWNITYEDLSRIAAWKANVVRFSLNQSFWLDSAKGALYQAYVDRAVKWTLSLGMDVILDLHWLTMGQTNISDGSSPTFWTQVAKKYANDGRVMFELFNEPHDISQAQWKSDMTGLYNAVRNPSPDGGGAKNLVLIGGLDWAYNLGSAGAGLPGNAINGTNIAYTTHPYSFKAAGPTQWDPAFGTLAATYPIIATEFGNANTQTAGGSFPCDPNFYNAMTMYFASHNMGWTAWAWFVDRGVSPPANTCGFPQLIVGYDGTTNPAGAAIKTTLAN
jgi:Cellulase (glycosyl hydrolase family 5)/Stigma-specific protein, Stig1